LGPPRVLRSVIVPLRQMAACRVPSDRLDQPATRPWLVMAMPRLWVPPSEDEYLTTWYDAVAEGRWASGPSGRADSLSPGQPHAAARSRTRAMGGMGFSGVGSRGARDAPALEMFSHRSTRAWACWLHSDLQSAASGGGRIRTSNPKGRPEHRGGPRRPGAIE